MIKTEFMSLMEELDKINTEDENLNESQAQEIAQRYKDAKEEFGVDIESYANEFMNTKYPDGFPDFAGDLLFSEKYWREFDAWLHDEKGIDLKTSGLDNASIDESLTEAYDDYEDDYTKALEIYQETEDFDAVIDFLKDCGYNIESADDRESSGKMAVDADYIFTDDMGEEWPIKASDDIVDTLNTIVD